MRRKYIMSREDIYAANNTNKSMQRNGIVSKVKSVQNNNYYLLALLGMSIKENLCKIFHIIRQDKNKLTPQEGKADLNSH